MSFRYIALSAALLFPSEVLSSRIHISPDIRLGPYAGAGISGLGIQLGVRDVFNTESIYFSYSATQAEFLYSQEDEIYTYRLGGEFVVMESPRMSFQTELGYVTYQGRRELIFGEKRTLTQEGISTAFSWIMEYNKNISFRAGLDLHYLDKSSTFLSVSLVPGFSTGVVFKF